MKQRKRQSDSKVKWQTGQRVHVLGQRPTQNVSIASKGYQYKHKLSTQIQIHTHTQTQIKAIKENG